MMTIDLEKPIPSALFDLRPLVGPVAWSLLTALIQNEYNDCPFGDAEPLSVEELAEMTGLGREEANASLWAMQNNSFIPVEIYFQDEASAPVFRDGRYRLDLDKTSRLLMVKEGE
jgi:hypothetical protein